MIVHDQLTYDTEDKRRLRAAVMTTGITPLDPDNVGLEAIFGLIPENSTFCPPAAAKLANVKNWPAGTRVEIYTLGLEVTQLKSS